MGAVLNLRPELFAAAVLGVPFVDCLTTMLDDSIPLTIIEVPSAEVSQTTPVHIWGPLSLDPMGPWSHVHGT